MLRNHRCSSSPFWLASGHLGYDAVNAAISSAAAQVPTNPLCDFLVGGMRMLFQKCLGRNRQAGSTEAALLRVIVDERLLHWMRLPIPQTFRRHDLLAFSLDRECGARVHGAVVDQHGAGAALTAVAHALWAGNVEVLA